MFQPNVVKIVQSLIILSERCSQFQSVVKMLLYTASLSLHFATLLIGLTGYTSAVIGWFSTDMSTYLTTEGASEPNARSQPSLLSKEDL